MVTFRKATPEECEELRGKFFLLKHVPEYLRKSKEDAEKKQKELKSKEAKSEHERSSSCCEGGTQP